MTYLTTPPALCSVIVARSFETCFAVAAHLVSQSGLPHIPGVVTGFNLQIYVSKRPTE